MPKLDQVNMLILLITILRELHLLFSPPSVQDLGYRTYPWLSCSCHCNRNKRGCSCSSNNNKMGYLDLFVLIIKIMGLSAIGAGQSTKTLWVFIFLTILVDGILEIDQGGSDV